MQVAIIFTSILSILIPIGVGLRRYSSLSLDARWILYMLIPIGINQFVSVWWIYYVNPNNIAFGHVYIVLELFFLSKIYYDYHKSSSWSVLVPVLTGVFYLFYIIKLFLDPASFLVYSTHERALSGLLILIYAISYFISVYRKQEVLELQKISGFWIAGGLILYFLSNTILYVFSELVFAQDRVVFAQIWSVHAVLNFLLYISFTLALLCRKTETKS